MNLSTSTVFICLCLLGPWLFGQKVKKARGEYQLRIERTESEEEACQRCFTQARINAIEKAFGTVMIQGNSTFLENTQTGEQTETVQIFNTIAETMVNGEWLRDLDEPSWETFEYEGWRWVKCSVKGEIGELTQAKVAFDMKTLDCEEERCMTDRFVDGEDFFLYFNSPVSGYLTVYLADQSDAQRLLPYSDMPSGLENAVPIKADEPYIFFSSRTNKLDIESYRVDEYELFAESPRDHHRLYVLFSEEPLNKPSLTPIYEDELGQTMPKSLSTEDFHKWLAKSWRYNKGMQIARLDITISK